MTAFTLNKPAPTVTASVLGSPSRDFHVEDRKRKQMNSDDIDVDTSKVEALSGSKSLVLSRLRRNYVSRGLRARGSTSFINNGACQDRNHRSSTDIVSMKQNPKVLDTNSDVEHFRVSDARRSVSLLKFASQREDEAETENDTDDESMSSDQSHHCSASVEERKYAIKFQCYVKVVEIPSRHSYSSVQRKRLWNDGKSIRANAKRNRMEYEWEGREWQNAPEENDFCTLGNGTIVHPAYALY